MMTEDKVANCVGELCGAAKHDMLVADPSDVGLNGIPIAQWRAAYFEGCNDMANQISSLVPAEHREAFEAQAHAAFARSFANAEKAHAEAISANVP